MEFEDRVRFSIIEKSSRENFKSSNPWDSSLREVPITSTMETSITNPFTGSIDTISATDPRFAKICYLLDSYKEKEKTKASNSFYFLRNAPKVYMTKEYNIYKGVGKEDISIESNSVAYVNRYDVPFLPKGGVYIYKGRIRKDLKDKALFIIGKTKKFLKVMDLDSGTKYRVWPDELERILPRLI